MQSWNAGQTIDGRPIARFKNGWSKWLDIWHECRKYTKTNIELSIAPMQVTSLFWSNYFTWWDNSTSTDLIPNPIESKPCRYFFFFSLSFGLKNNHTDNLCNTIRDLLLNALAFISLHIYKKIYSSPKGSVPRASAQKFQCDRSIREYEEAQVKCQCQQMCL